MDYKINIGNETKEVEIVEISASSETEEFKVSIKGPETKPSRIRILKRQTDRFIISIDERVYSIVQQDRSQSAVTFLVNGNDVRARIMTGEKERSPGSSLMATANELVVSNFPAKIVKLLVKKGDSLKEGDTLVILEAMKMEAQIKAPRDCAIEEVFVKEGEMVERGKGMIRLKFG
jgi:biotin carboxyl carrier protein